MWLSRLYLLTVALLITHEVDSAYWMEWQLFGLPGGLGGFVGAHLPVVALFIWGYGRLCAGARSGLWLSMLLALTGLFAVGAHAAMLIAGRPEFRTRESLGLLTAVAVASAIQLPVTLRQLKPDLLTTPVSPSGPRGTPLAGDVSDLSDDGTLSDDVRSDGGYDPLADDDIAGPPPQTWSQEPPAGPGRSPGPRRGRRSHRPR
jgi:hypothetical protein